MLIGSPREIKSDEHRVGLVPDSVRELTSCGHHVLIEADAGRGIGVSDRDYVAAAALIADLATEIFARADLIVKVKEPQKGECRAFRLGQILFTYLHLAADRSQTEDLINSGGIRISYETVTDDDGRLPLLAPMSEVGGRMAAQVAAQCLEKRRGGSGVLFGCVPGVRPAKVVILGGGVAGTNSARVAMGLGADVVVIDRSIRRLRHLDELFGPALRTIFSSTAAIEQEVAATDVVIGAVLVPGAAAPKLVSRQVVAQMRPGSVVVDISIDQGGSFETSRPTSHAEPTYVIDGVVHYCVTNMPGAVARTSAFALNNATLTFIVSIASKGIQNALSEDAHLKNGLNVAYGRVTHKAVAESLALPFSPVVPELSRKAA